MKNQKGSIAMFVLVACLFCITFLTSMFIISSAKRQAQIEITKQTENVYNSGNEEEIYNSYFATGDEVPIYTKEQLLQICGGQDVSINEENGKIYNFGSERIYLLQNDIELEYNGIWQPTFTNNGRIEGNSNKIKIKDTSKVDITYYYYTNQNHYKQPLTNEGYLYRNLILAYDGVNNTGTGHSNTTTTWKDLSGNGNDGVLNGFAYTTTSGWATDGLVLDGTDDCIYLANKMKDLFKSDCTIEMVVKFDEDDVRSIILGNYDNTNNINIEKGYLSTQGRIYYKSGSVNYFTANDLYGLGIKQSIGFRLNKASTKFAFLKNAIEQYSTIDNIFAENYDFTNANIGKDNRASTEETALKGTIYAVRIYNRTLSDEEMKNNYEVDQKIVQVEDEAKQYDSYSSFSGVNKPKLTQGMIPVYYDGGWKKADSTNTNNNWYKYDTSTKQWANVVTVKETGGTKTRDYYTQAAVGEPIVESDILAMFVWIPRFSYKITSGYNQTADGTGNIEIQFLKGVTNEYKGGTAIKGKTTNGTDYIVHPAFTNNTSLGGYSNEIIGFWVGKFESSSTNPTTGTVYGGGDTTALSVKIIPNVTSWRNIDITNILTVCQAMNKEGNIHGLTNQINTSIMKNSQWGACAYLAQSNYGNKQISSDSASGIWSNSYHNGDSNFGTLTGVVGASRDASTANGTLTTTYYTYATANGKKGSTTRNVYGIYDMAGGAWEYMAGYLKGATSNTRVTTFNTKEERYVTRYAGNSSDTQTNYNANTNMYGDAVYETSSSGAGGQYSWNGDHAEYPISSYPFFIRGGAFYHGVKTGAFCYSNDYGGTRAFCSFRVVAL